LSFPFALLCVAAIATHPGAVASKAVAPPAPASAATSPPSDQAPTPPASADQGDFNDEPQSSNPRDSDWQDRAARRHIRRHNPDRDLVSIGHGSHLPVGEKADAVVSVFGSSSSDG
jgi:hypothetical protein